MPVPEWWVGQEPSCFLLVWSPSVFAYYSSLMVGGSEADKANISWTAITKYFVFASVPLAAAAQDGVFMSKIADSRTVADDLWVLVQTPDHWSHLD